MRRTGSYLPECTQAIHRLFFALDRSDHETIVGLFAPDATWFRQGTTLRGHHAIRAALDKRSATQRVRHLVANGFIESQSDAAVRFAAYMIAYRFDDGSVHDGPVPISRPLRLSTLHAELVECDGMLRIADLQLLPEFEFVPEGP